MESRHGMDEPDYVPYIRDFCRTLQRFDIVHFGRHIDGKPNVVDLFCDLKEYWKEDNE